MKKNKFKEVLVLGLACLTFAGLAIPTFASEGITNKSVIKLSSDVVPLGIPYERDIYASDGDALEYFKATGVWRLYLENHSNSDLIFYVYDENGDKLGIGENRLKPGKSFTSGLVPGIENSRYAYEVKMYTADGSPLSVYLKIRDDIPVR